MCPVEPVVSSTETESDEDDYLVGSSHGSLNGHSQVFFPPSTPLNGKDDAWDVLHTAPGHMVRTNINDDGVKYGRGLLGPPRKSSPVTAPLKNTTWFYSNHAPALTHQHIQANHLKQQQQQQQQKCSSAWGRQGQGKLVPSLTPPSAAAQPQQARSGGAAQPRFFPQVNGNLILSSSKAQQLQGSSLSSNQHN